MLTFGPSCVLRPSSLDEEPGDKNVSNTEDEDSRGRRLRAAARTENVDAPLALDSKRRGSE